MKKQKGKKKRPKNIEELTAGYEKYMKGKIENPNLAEDFDRVLKKSVKPTSAP